MEIPCKSRRKLGQRGTYPIKLLYASHGPLLFLYHLISYIIILAQLGHVFYPENTWIHLLGVWHQSEITSQLIPTSGLSYWLNPPSVSTFFTLHTSVYIIYMLTSFAILSRISINWNDQSGEEVAEDLIDCMGLTMAGQKVDSDLKLRQELERVIPVAAILGGLVLGCVCIASDIVGINGGGQGMMLTTSIIYGYYERAVEDRALLPPETQLDMNR